MVIALDRRALATSARLGTVEAAPDAEQLAPVPSSAGPSSADLEEARDNLLERLHARSDDFAATEQLQALRRELSLTSNVDTDHDQPVRLRNGGLSFFDRLRARLHRRRARHGRSQ
jgi:hypothetical protein